MFSVVRRLALSGLSGGMRSFIARPFAKRTEKKVEDVKAKTSAPIVKAKKREPVVPGAIDAEIPDLQKYQKGDVLRKLNFETLVKPVLDKLKSLGFNQKHFNLIAKVNPKAFVVTDRPEKKGDPLRLIEMLEKDLKVSNPDVIRSFILRRPQVLTQSIDQTRTTILGFKDLMRLSEDDFSYLIRKNPHMFFFDKKKGAKIGKLLVQGLQYDWKTAMEMAQKKPLILNGHLEDLEKMQLYLYEAGFTCDELKQLVDIDLK